MFTFPRPRFTFVSSKTALLSPFAEVPIVGLLVEQGETNDVFSKIIQANKNKSSGGVDIDLNALYKKTAETYHYLGSFTTPPCTEGVEWFVVKNPIRLSSQQIKFLANSHPGNNRPLQDYLDYKNSPLL